MDNRHFNHKTAFTQKAVLLDMDGTLHKEDAFFNFGLYVTKKRWYLTVLFFPILMLGLIIYALLPKHKIGINIILMVLLVGLNKNTLNYHIHQFSQTFKATYTPFSIIQNKLEDYLNHGYQVFIVTGTPIAIAQALYPNWHNDQHNNKVHWLGSKFNQGKYFYYLQQRCFSGKKVVLLNEYLKEHGLTCQFIAGFSDSKHDLPMMTLCDEQYWVNKQGNIIA